MQPAPGQSSSSSVASESRQKILANLFEPSTQLNAIISHDSFVIQGDNTPLSYNALIDAVQTRMTALLGSGTDTKDEGDEVGLLKGVVNGHPRLGERQQLSQSSETEQASLRRGGDTGDEGRELDLAEELDDLNRRYETKYNGLSTFVNGRSRSELVKDLRERVDDDRGSYAEELAAAVQATCDIARDRAAKLSASKGTL